MSHKNKTALETPRLAGALAGLLALTLLLVPSAQAADAPKDPKKQTPWGLYLTAEEAAAFKADDPAGVLFVDVRDPVEIMFTGFTDAVDTNIPFKRANTAAWNEKKQTFAMAPNPAFAQEVLAALEARGLDRSAPVLVMCRSGLGRGVPAAKALAPLGLENVYVVIDGFEGGTSKEIADNPVRSVNGWKNAGLPWSYKLNPQKVQLETITETGN